MSIYRYRISYNHTPCRLPPLSIHRCTFQDSYVCTSSALSAPALTQALSIFSDQGHQSCLIRSLTESTYIVFSGKYIGDAIMAFWNSPDDCPDHPTAACAAALAMQRHLGDLRGKWAARGLPPVHMRLGVYTASYSPYHIIRDSLSRLHRLV
jgi:hypothetical protein